jgi:hypothetical protein
MLGTFGLAQSRRKHERKFMHELSIVLSLINEIALQTECIQ